MKIKTIEVYSFDELSDDAKKKAIQKLCDINVDFDWWDSTYEDARNIGIKITGFDIDRKQTVSGEFINSAGETIQDILREHGENCETYKTAMRYKHNFDLASDETDEDELSASEDEFLNDILEDYRIILRNEYEYLTSEEAIIETIKANDYTFTIDGKLENI